MQGTTKSDLKATGWESTEWAHLAHNRDQRRDLLNVVMQLGVPVDVAVVLPSPAKVDLFKTDSAPWSQQISQLGRSFMHTTGSLRCKEVH